MVSEGTTYDATFVMAVAVLGTATVNFLHWLRLKDSRLLYTPKSGWSRITLIALSIGSGLCAVLFLPGRIPGTAFLTTLFGLSLAHGLYSICCRHREHRVGKPPQKSAE